MSVGCGLIRGRWRRERGALGAARRHLIGTGARDDADQALQVVGVIRRVLREQAQGVRNRRDIDAAEVVDPPYYDVLYEQFGIAEDYLNDR